MAAKLSVNPLSFISSIGIYKIMIQADKDQAARSRVIQEFELGVRELVMAGYSPIAARLRNEFYSSLLDVLQYEGSAMTARVN